MLDCLPGGKQRPFMPGYYSMLFFACQFYPSAILWTDVGVTMMSDKVEIKKGSK